MNIDPNDDARWDMHSERQIAASKGGAAAVTILNTGSWLALLSQASALTEASVGLPIALWGAGAFFGTSIWLFIYRGAGLQWLHDQDRDDAKISKKLDNNILFGYLAAVLALVSFAAGVAALAHSFW